MNRHQGEFAAFYKNLAFGPRNGFKARGWQEDCQADYEWKLSEHEELATAQSRIDQFRYTVSAGTGSGKTSCAGLISVNMLNTKRVGMLVLVSPNRATARKAKKDFMRNFGIELVSFNSKKYRHDGIPRGKQGYITTYANVVKNPVRHAELCSLDSTLVILDEFHHLGDKKAWGEAVSEAFGGCPYIFSMSGTPYRVDNNPIPFVSYGPPDENGIRRLKTDFSYELPRAIHDKVCRVPHFIFHDGTMLIRTQWDGPEIKVQFNQDVSNSLSRTRLRGAVEYGSVVRRNILEEALPICRKEGRKVIIFLGGDTVSDRLPTEDAKNYLPSELEEMGISPEEFDFVTGDDSEAQRKIEEFGESTTKWILISINMVSEGVDIPELSAAIFLSSICAKLTLVQRIGRTLRLRGDDDPHKTSLVFMPASPELIELSDEIYREIKHEVELGRQAKREFNREGDGVGSEKKAKAQAIGIDGGNMTLVKMYGREWPISVFNKAMGKLQSKGMSPSLAEITMYLILQEETNGIGIAG